MKFLFLIFFVLYFTVPTILGYYFWFDTFLILNIINLLVFVPILGTFNWYKHKQTFAALPSFLYKRYPQLDIFIYIYPFVISYDLNKGKKVVSVFAFCRQRKFYVINIILSKNKEIISVELQ